MPTAQERAETVIRNESWWGRTLNPPGDRRILARLIAAAIEEAQRENAVESPECTFKKCKA